MLDMPIVEVLCTFCKHSRKDHVGQDGSCLAVDDGIFCTCLQLSWPGQPDTTCPLCRHLWVEHRQPIINWQRACSIPGCMCIVEIRGYPQVLWDQKSDHDPVNHPSHYTQHPSGVECIQITEHYNFCIGNAIKYLWRHEDKNSVEDLHKAIWYINREIERLTNVS